MKAAQTKTPAATPAKSTPFFNKEGGQDFFATTTEQPFFSAKTKTAIQPKLTVGKPNDVYEREADAMADKIVQRRTEPLIQKKELDTKPAAPVQAKCDDCEKDEKLQKKEETVQPKEKLPPQPVAEVKAVKELQPKPLAVQKKPASLLSPVTPSIQAKCSSCEEDEKLQKKDDDKDPSEKILRKTIFESNEEQPIQRKQSPISLKRTGISTVQAKCSDCEQEEKLQKKEAIDTKPQTVQLKPGAEPVTPKKTVAPVETLMPLVKTAPASAPPVQAKCAACEQEEQKGEQEEEGELSGIRVQKKPIFESNADEDDKPRIQRTCRECEEGKEIFLKPAYIQRAGDSAAGNGSRESIVAAARGELGKVQAKHDDGSGKRVGSDRLLEYFHVAAPGVWDDSIIETAGADMPSWCGIFSVWAHKKAGKDIGNWEMGKGVSSFHTLTNTDNPQPGDIGYIHKPKQHHCIIQRIEGDTVYSIDGNSGLFSEVVENTRPRSAYTLFMTAFGGGASSGSVQTKEEEGSGLVQLSPNETVASSDVEQKLSSSSGGHSLPESTRSGMEAGFGADFSSVRIHTDSNAVQMSQDLHAQAFTHGSDIYFNTGKFDTGSTSGQHLLAHELTHVVQQGNAPAQSVNRLPDPAQEEEAEPVSEKVERELPKFGIALKPDIQKDDPPPATPAPAVTPDADTDTTAQAVYDALDGWTSSGDSANIVTRLRTRNKATVDAVILGVGRRGTLSNQGVFDWMKSDMVTSDWVLLRNRFILIRVQGVEEMIAANVYDLMSGYTSDADSTEILHLFVGESPVMGPQMGLVLAALRVKTGQSADDTADWLFNDMTSLDADRLSTHFFSSGSTEGIHYATHWRAKKVYDLLTGWTGADDSTMIVVNFERTPASVRSYVLYALDTLCQARWTKPASEVLMKNMWQSDYIRLRTLVPELPVWNVSRNFLDWAWEAVSVTFDYIGAILEYAVCGIAGAVWGVVLIIRDIVAVVWDLAKAIYYFIGWVVHQFSPGLAREEADAFSGFFTSMGQFFGAPGTAIAHMWNELVLESHLIEGPFRECRQAFFWMTRIANFLVNIVLILAGGYGLAKMVAEGIEALINLVRAGDLIAALGRLSVNMYKSIRGLPAAIANGMVRGIGRVVSLITRPAQVVESVRNTVAIIRLAASEEGYYNFLRAQAGRAVAAERGYWRERRAFYMQGAETGAADLTNVESKLVQAVDTAVSDPNRAQTLISEAGADADAANTQADDLLNEIRGEIPAEPASFDSRLPEQWRSGSPARPGMLDYSVTKLRAMNISEETILAIIQQAATHANEDAYNFFANLNRFALRGQDRLGQAGFDLVIRGLSTEPNFATAQMLMYKVANSPQNLVSVMRLFTLEDIAAVRTRCPAGTPNDFFNDLNTIASRITGSKEEVLALMNEAGQGQQSMDRLLEALTRVESPTATPQQVRDALDYGRRLANAIAAGGDEAARAVWGDAFAGRDPATGRIRVAKALTADRSGDRASAYIRARIRGIVNSVLGGEGGTQIDPVRWGVIRDSILNTDLPTLVKYDVLGEIWAASKVEMYRNMGYTVIREVSIRVLNADGTDSAVYSKLDAVLRRGQEILYKEFKSTATATTSPAQDTVYPLLNQGRADLLRPFGPNAEAAFGGPAMPDFAARPVSIERPTFGN